MNGKHFNKNGFSLIEVIASLVLLGILTAAAGLGLVYLSEGYVFARSNAEAVGKGQLALSRIVKEFSAIDSVSIGVSNSITFTRSTGPSRTIAGGGGMVTINNEPLIDNVSAFTLSYQTDVDSAPQSTYTTGRQIINISLTLDIDGQHQRTFTGRVYIRPYI